MTHEQIMGKAWQLIRDLGISDYKETNPYYLVKNIHQVRDAFYEDIESEIDFEDDDVESFFERHNIDWE